MSKSLLDKLLGRVEPLEEVCDWKEISETEVIVEGKLRECKENCNGYNEKCDCYYNNKGGK